MHYYAIVIMITNDNEYHNIIKRITMQPQRNVQVVHRENNATGTNGVFKNNDSQNNQTIVKT